MTIQGLEIRRQIQANNIKLSGKIKKVEINIIRNIYITIFKRLHIGNH